MFDDRSSLPSDPPRYTTTVPLLSRELLAFCLVTTIPVLVLVAIVLVAENEPLWTFWVPAIATLVPLVLLTRLRLVVSVYDQCITYQVRPWHLHPRVIAFESITSIDRRYARPRGSLSLRRVNLGRSWIDWNGEAVRYVLARGIGIRLERSENKAIELWVPNGTVLADEIDAVRTDRSR